MCLRAGEVLTLTARHDCDELRARPRIRAPGASGPAACRALPRGGDQPVAGYEDLAELDWDEYRARYGNIGRLDRILEAEGDSPNGYKLAKQADVLILIYLLGPDGLLEMLTRLRYPAAPERLTRTVGYHLSRTAHRSTLSRVVHASVLARMDRGAAWQAFRDVLAADLDDTQGGITGEGIHLGAMAGTIDIITRSFYRVRIENAAISSPQPLTESGRFGSSRCTAVNGSTWTSIPTTSRSPLPVTA